MTDPDGLSDAERRELEAVLAREKQRLAPYHRKKRLATLAAMATVAAVWLPGFLCLLFSLGAGRLPIRWMLVLGIGGVVAGAAVHRRLSPSSPLIGG